MPKQIARRMMLRLLGLAGITLLVGPKVAAALPEATMGERLTALLADPASARRVGHAYLQANPGEGDREQLIANLVERLDGNPSRMAYTACCRQDFAAGRTVRVGGWMLSQTEVKLCALAALA